MSTFCIETCLELAACCVYGFLLYSAYLLMLTKIPKGRAYEAVLIGQQIRHIRRMKDISQNTLAQNIGVTLGWIGRVERGIHLPNLKLLFKIAKALQVRVRDLIPAEL